jgi:hypothetical protein
MRRPSRNIEIFSMSVLDMFASALGAFIMIAIILFPYYQKNRPIKEKLDAAVAELKRTQEDVDKTKAQAEKIEQQNDDTKAEIQKVQLAQVELNRCKQDVAACLIELGSTFLLIKIAWNDRADVDLHVKDPQGNEFFFAKSNRNGQAFPGSQGRLSTDTAIGPGIEVWQIPTAAPGTYQIEYVMESSQSTAVTVHGLFFDRSGKKPLPDKVIGSGQNRVPAGTIEVAIDGRVSLR